MGNKTKYGVGDLVLIKKTNEVGQVIKIDSVFNSNYGVYIVKVGSFERLYTENYLSLYRDKKVINKVKELDVNNVMYSLEAEEKIDSLIDELELKKSNTNKGRLKNVCKLVKYFSLRKKKDALLVTKSNDISLNELFKGFSSDNDNVANCYLFREVLKRVNIDALCVILKDKDDQFHISNLVLLGDYYYYFDLSIEKSIYVDSNDDSFVFCCSGIGSDNYEKFFKPISLLAINDTDDIRIPKNISKRDIDFKLLNKIMKVDE